MNGNNTGDVRFNLQEFLSEMREEQRTGFATLHGRISGVQNKVNDHETRVTVIEKTHRAIGWLAGTAIVAVLGAGATWFFATVSKLFAATK